MKKLKGYEIRQMWLDFFSSKGHEVIPSASLIPHDDPTLLWINAGVAPLKKYFDGREKPNNPRMTNAQKSIRTNDIDNVGKTSRHHTFFEMLGNFSIGDYFREDAIKWATELLFDEKWFAIDKNKIYITYYPDDLDTKNCWMKNGVEESHLIPLVDNFWEIGEGPCGPDTEIFFDRGEKYDPKHLEIKMLKEDIENDRYIEIWNIVLSQFNSTPGIPREQYKELPSKNIDTGSGLERLACIFQGTDSNYETDLFLPLIEFVENLSGKKYDDSLEYRMAFRVISDHIRSICFAVADGAMLSNEGRGYVLRRILRRASRYGRKLGITKPFLYQMVDVVVDNYKQFYPYLIDKKEIVTEIVKKEEMNFLRTLEKGEKKIQEIISETLKNNKKTLSGKDAFLLYDTFGFPFELTLEVAEEKNLTVDEEEFKIELENQKNRARQARNAEQSMNKQVKDYLEFKTPNVFVGYDTLDSNSKIIGLFSEGNKVDSGHGHLVVVLDKTPFYAEMGGQIGDQGLLYIDDNAYTVIDTFKLPNGQHASIIDSGDNEIKMNSDVHAFVDEEFRLNVAVNHTATHLLNESLRRVLGSHVSQHGSLVTDSRLRFDFNHFESINDKQILEIERLTNEAVKANYPVITHIMKMEDAKKTGAQAVFGEKYGDVVRVVDMDYSKEFCGGTHLKNTGAVDKLAVLSVESKGSGIYRIECVAGSDVLNKIDNYLLPQKTDLANLNKRIKDILDEAKKNQFNLNSNLIDNPILTGSYLDVINYKNAIIKASETIKELDKEFNNLYRNKYSNGYKQYFELSQKINDLDVILVKVENQDVNIVKDIIDKLACELEKCVILFANVVNDEKIIFVAKSKNNANSAGQLVKLAATITGGNGGGRPDFAQAGGKDKSKLDEALLEVKRSIK